MTDELRVAVAGTGFVGRIHARSARLAGARLVGVAASTPERSRLAAETLRAERHFDRAEELVTADNVDVVHLCTPNHLHAPLARAALEAGKHVVCEKPLATSIEEARALASLAAGSGLVATVPFVYRFYPTVREMRQRARGGALGDLRVLHGHYLQDWLADSSDYNWRVDPALGGASRAFADIGSHWCDLVEFVTGHRIVRLVADVATPVERRRRSDHAEAFGAGTAAGDEVAVGTEDVATVLFRTDGGASGALVVSQLSPGRKNRLWLEIDGAAGALAFDQESPEALWTGSRGGAGLLPRDPTLLDPAAAVYATLPGGHPQGYHDCFDAFVADTYQAVRGASPDGLPTFDDGLRASVITDAVLASAANGAWVEVQP